MTLLHDLRLSLRTLLKSPAFTLTALISLAIGLGATTTVFTFVNAFFLRPLPGIEAQDQLVNLHQKAVDDERSRRFSKPTYDDIVHWNEVFSGLAAFTDRGFNLNADGETGLIVGQLVSGNYFDVLGVEAAAGRLLTAEDDRAGGPPVVVLSHRLWRKRFGADPEIVGSTVRLNGGAFTVIGVAAERFIGTFVGFASEIFVPLAMAEIAIPGTDLDDRDADLVELVGRRLDGVSSEQVQAGLDVIGRQLGREYFREQPGYGIVVTPVTGFDEEVRVAVTGLLGVLFAVALLVLVIACVNVANMLLVRAATRGREIVVRLALGAPRRRVIGQLLNESVLLALGGGALGLLVAVWSVEALRAFDPTLTTAVSLALDFRLDARVLSFMMLASLAAGLLFGLAPALQVSRPDLSAALSAAVPTGSGKSLLRSVFVVGQIALTLLLLVAAGLFLRVLGQAAAIDPGFEARGVLTAAVDSSLLGLEGPAERQDFYRRLVSQLEGENAFEAISLTRAVPLSFGRTRIAITVEGHQPPAGEGAFEIDAATVGPGYFETLRVPVLRGRGFEVRDRHDTPRVAVVNETFARHFWPGEEAIGQRFRRDGESIEVIGLAGDGKYNTLNEEPTPYLYLPFDQTEGHRVTLLARTLDTADGAPATATLRRALRAFEEELPVLVLMPMTRLIGISLLPQRIAGTVAGVLGGIALLLAAFGVYGVVAFSANQRTRELGVRASLGARRHDLVGLIVGQGLRLIAFGVAAGLAVSLIATRLLASFLVGVSPTDPLTFLVIVTLLAGVALLASYLPARRAARIDPVTSLRSE